MQSDVTHQTLHRDFNASVNASGLEPYSGPWTKKEAAHLVRRTHFGVKVNDINFLRSFTDAGSAVDMLVENAISSPLPDDPQWYSSGLSGDVLDVYDIQFRWMDQMYNKGLKERMILFWSNHFAVSYSNMNALPEKAGSSYASHMYNYWKLLHQNSFGNFRDFVLDMSKNSAMLYYLNNYNNRSGQPNEDFARELMELFTMGEKNNSGSDNYSETDVKEVARAVTGWRVNNSTLRGYFDANRHDSASKTIFGNTGNYNLDSVIDLIFQERAEETAWFICRKLYVFFVCAEPDEGFINELSVYFLNQNFDIAAVLKKLLSSAHFYEERFIGSRIKSPIEAYMSYLRELEVAPDSELKEYIRVRMQESNEELLRPETVFGWDGYNPPSSDGIPGHYAWLNTNLMPSRWDDFTNLINGNDISADQYNPINIAQKISNPSDPFALAEDIARHLIALPLDQVDIREVEDDFAGNPRNAPDVSSFPEYKINLAKILLGNIPWYEWRPGTDDQGNLTFNPALAENLRQYISYLHQLPAYQLI